MNLCYMIQPKASRKVYRECGLIVIISANIIQFRGLKGFFNLYIVILGSISRQKICYI